MSVLRQATAIRILTVDDHQLLREGIAAVLESQEDMTLVAQASNGREAVESFRCLRPDVTLMVSMTHSAVASYEHGWASVRCTVASTGSAANSAGSEALLSPDGHSTMRPSRVSSPSTTTTTVRVRSTVGVVDIDPSAWVCPCE